MTKVKKLSNQEILSNTFNTSLDFSKRFLSLGLVLRESSQMYGKMELKPASLPKNRACKTDQ